MKKESVDIKRLRTEIIRLKQENTKLKKSSSVNFLKESTVKTPKNIQPIFEKAQETVGNYFKSLRLNPSKGSIDN